MPDQKTSQPNQPPSEKKEFLRREEIRTMQKEINKIREEGVRKEREKIVGTEVEREKPSFASASAKAAADRKTPENREEIKTEKPIGKTDAKAPEISENLTAKEKAPAKPSTEQEAVPENEIIEQKKQIEKRLQELSSEIQSLRVKKNQLTSESDNLKLELAPISQNEKAIEAKKKTTEERESKAVDTEEKRKIEQERWEIDKQREAIEKERWAIEEDIESCQKQLRRIDLDLYNVLSEKNEIDKQREAIEKKEKELKFREEKIRLEKELEILEAGRPAIENEKNSRMAQKNKIAENLRKVLENEKNAEETIKQLEQKEGEAANPQDKRKIEQERQQMEIERSELEKSRWEAESEDNRLDSELKKIEASQKESAERRETIKNRLAGINSQASRVSPENFQKETEEKVASEPVPPKTEQAERQNIPKEPTQAWIKPEEELKEGMENPINQEMPEKEEGQPETLLDKEEIARKAFIERTRESENKESVHLPKTMAKDYQQKQESITPRHQKQSWLEKIWVRIVLVVLICAILFFVATFWYWYLVINK